MTLVLVRVSPAALAEIQRKPEHLEVILDAEDFAPELGVADDDRYPDLNYRGAARFFEERLDADSEDFDPDKDDDPVLRDLGADGRLPYQAPYGSAFTISPASAKRATASSLLIADDDELRVWVGTAAERGAYIVGIVI